MTASFNGIFRISSGAIFSFGKQKNEEAHKRKKGRNRKLQKEATQGANN